MAVWVGVGRGVDVLVAVGKRVGEVVWVGMGDGVPVAVAVVRVGLLAGAVTTAVDN